MSIAQVSEPVQEEPPAYPDFTDTEIAFQNKSDKELLATFRLFRLMNKSWLVDAGSTLSKFALHIGLPFVETAMKKTIFRQFCGGVNLVDCQEVIDHLYSHNTLTILDYGAEAKTEEEDLDEAAEELMKAIDFAASNNSVPVVSSKLTALIANELLIKKQNKQPLSRHETKQFRRFLKRINSACKRAQELGVGIFIDAEESWMQVAMDEVVYELMKKYNRDQVIVYNTYQLYRHDKLAQLKEDYKKARKEGFMLGAKLVRGAYMEKERDRAKELGYPSPIQPDKASTDRDYNEAVLFCLERYEEIAFCNATHNLDSVKLMVDEIIARGIPRAHRHVNFCQLQGMSDYITFNLSQAGFNTAKYVVYGPVKDVVEYLIRRAEENTAVTGEMSRELSLVSAEKKRRGL